MFRKDKRMANKKTKAAKKEQEVVEVVEVKKNTKKYANRP